MNSPGVIKTMHQLEKYADSGDIRRVIETLRCQPTGQTSGLVQNSMGIEKTYSLVLDYYKTSLDDSKREEIFHKLVSDLYGLIYRWADAADSCDKERISHDRLLSVIRELKDHDGRIGSGELLKELFDNVWQIMPTKETASVLEDYLTCASFDRNERCVMLGSVIFALSQRFIPDYIWILIHVIESGADELRTRSIVGLMLALQKHADRVLWIPSLTSRLKMMFDDRIVKRDMLTAFLMLLKSAQTKTITDRLNNDIAPDIMSSGMNLGKYGGDMISEWNEMVAGNNKLRKGIEKLYRWQSEGADVLLGTFVHLKDYSFFKHLSGWLKPFDENGVELEEVKRLLSEVGCGDVTHRVAMSSMMCDSDKYSFMLSFLSIPRDHIEMLCTAYSMQLESCEETENSDISDFQYHNRANLFVHDLYRVFYVHGSSSKFDNPFECLTEFIWKSKLTNMLFDIQDMELIADFLGEHEQYRSAAIIYEQLLKVKADSEGINDRLAYCYISNGDYSSALHHLGVSENKDGESYWRLKMKAQCYDGLKMYSEELKILEQMASKKPNEMPVKLKMANCFKMMGAYDEEMSLRFEIDYLKPTAANAYLTADCLLRQGYVDRAASYVSRVGLDAECQILVSAYKMCTRKIDETIDILGRMGQTDIEKFVCSFDVYEKSFIGSGVSRNDLRIVADIVGRDIRNE